MSLQPPKIDKRSYDDIVAQTEALVEDFTSEVPLNVQALLGRTLAEEVKDRDQPIAPSGKVIDKDLADKISKIQGLDRVKVKGWQALVACEIDPKDKSKTLAGLILNQDVKDGDKKIATRGAVIDTVLAEKLSQIEGLSRVKVKMQPPGYLEVEPNALVGRTLDQDVKDNNNTIAARGTVVDAALAKKISQILSLKLVKVKVETDAGRALIRIFGRMAALVSDRLNQVPDKNFLAFLDLIGTQLLPPQPAKVPLTFSLAQGSPVDALVPAHTQVAAPPAEGQEDEVVFETDRELVVTTAQLQAVFVREPEKDCYSDRTSQATGEKDAAFEAFAGEQPIEHCLYLACDELFTLPGDKTLALEMRSPQAADLAQFPITWSYWDGIAWKPLLGIVEGLSVTVDASTSQVKIAKGRAIDSQGNEIDYSPDKPPISLENYQNQTLLLVISAESSKSPDPIIKVAAADINKYPAETHIRLARLKIDAKGKVSPSFEPSVQSGNNSWKLQVSKKLAIPAIRAINGLNAGWLRANLNTSLSIAPDSSRLPRLESIKATVKVTRSDIAPELCFFNTAPLDISKDFYPFGQQPRFNDTVYIAHQEVFARLGAKVTVNVQLSSPPPAPINASHDLEIKWETWDGQGWQSLEIDHLSDTTNAFRQTGEIKFSLPSNVTSAIVSGENKYWIRARIVQGNYGTEVSQALTIALLTENSKIENNKTVLTVNSVRGFMPNDRIQIVSGGLNPETRKIESSDNTRNTLTLETALNQTYPRGTSVMLLSDSVFGPPSVKSLSLSYEYEASLSLSACCAYNDFHYVDLLTGSLREEAISGQKILKLASVSGFAKGDRLWINRSEEREIEAIDLEQRTVTVEPALAAGCAAEKSVEFFTILQEEAKSGETILKLSSVKQFAVGDRLRIVTTNTDDTQEYEIERVNLDSHSVTLKPELTQTYPENTKVLQSFQPFKATADRDRTLYLGFDKPFANRPTTLFAQVEPPQAKEVASELKTSDTKPVQLVWEYASPSGWSRLGVRDETNAFAERGLIQFIGPTDLIKTSEFGQELYWLRVRWQEGQFRVPPRLRRLLTNTMWATQATTLKDEILGSSDGNPNRIFRTVQKPVLNGQQLEVQEAKIPSPEEQAVIKSLEGDDAVNIVRDETGQIEAVWVRWHKVRDFYGSGSRDRHYVLDRLTGEVRFGDGQYGMVPPQGRNNIRLSQYQTGGGTRGNLHPNTVVQLKTTVPYVEKVTNLEAAGGGAEQESIEQVKERGPKFLRHRDRAVTWQDFEDLAYEASPDVARAKAIAPSFDPLDHNLWIKDPKAPNLDQHKKVRNAGQIRMLIVPRSTARQPVPSLALIDRVEAYIRERCDPSVNLQVTGPEWQAVSITAVVVPVSLERADAVRAAVVQHLENFLHPLTGGKKGQGWALGRLPQQSDLYAVIESIQGVDHVQFLKVEPGLKEEQLSPEKLVYSGTHTITSILPKEGA